MEYIGTLILIVSVLWLVFTQGGRLLNLLATGSGTGGKTGVIRSRGTSLRSRVTEKGLNLAIAYLKDSIFSEELKGIGRILSIEIHDRRLAVSIELKGLENRPFHVVCNRISIAADGSWIDLRAFTSNADFLTNLLNDFAARRYPVADADIRRRLLQVCSCLDVEQSAV